MKRFLITLILLASLFLTAQPTPALIDNYDDPCDTEWVEMTRYVCYTKYNIEDLRDAPLNEEVEPVARKFCKELNGGFQAVIRDGVRGFVSTAGQFIEYNGGGE